MFKFIGKYTCLDHVEIKPGRIYRITFAGIHSDKRMRLFENPYLRVKIEDGCGNTCYCAYRSLETFCRNWVLAD